MIFMCYHRGVVASSRECDTLGVLDVAAAVGRAACTTSPPRSVLHHRGAPISQYFVGMVAEGVSEREDPQRDRFQGGVGARRAIDVNGGGHPLCRPGGLPLCTWRMCTWRIITSRKRAYRLDAMRD